MAMCKRLVVGEGSDLRDACECGVAPAVRRSSEPGQRVAQETPEQLREPPRPVERVFDARTPLAGTQAVVARNSTTRSRRPAVEEERVHVREAHNVSDRLARTNAVLPVDHARNTPTRKEHVSEPEISVDSRARDAVPAEAGVDCGQRLHPLGGRLVCREATREARNNSRIHLQRRDLSGRRALESSEPYADSD